MLQKISPHPQQLAFSARLHELRGLKAGWLEGRGEPLAADGLNWLNDAFERYYPADLSMPFLYPTAEGNIQAEWTLGKNEVSLEIDLGNHSGEWHVLNLATEVEQSRELHLDGENDWDWVLAQLHHLNGGEG